MTGLSASRTPEEVVAHYRRTATTQDQRVLADMLDTYRQRADYWQAKESLNKLLEIERDALLKQLDEVRTDHRGRLYAIETALVDALDKQRAAESRRDDLLVDNTRLELARREATYDAKAARATLATVEKASEEKIRAMEDMLKKSLAEMAAYYKPPTERLAELERADAASFTPPTSLVTSTR